MMAHVHPLCSWLYFNISSKWRLLFIQLTLQLETFLFSDFKNGIHCASTKKNLEWFDQGVFMSAFPTLTSHMYIYIFHYHLVSIYIISICWYWSPERRYSSCFLSLSLKGLLGFPPMTSWGNSGNSWHTSRACWEWFWWIAPNTGSFTNWNTIG